MKKQQYNKIIRFTKHVVKKEGLDLDEIGFSDEFKSNQVAKCSRKQFITFNEKILTFPKEDIRQIILHELSHLKQLKFNHNKEFKADVDELLKKYPKLQ